MKKALMKMRRWRSIIRQYNHIMDTIKCIYCGKEFEISEALREHIRTQEISKIERLHQEEVQKYKQKMVRAEENELRVRKQKELLEEEKRKFELEKQRQIDAERQKIRETTMKEADVQARLKMKEKDLTIERLNKQLEEAKRTASMGSQQTQGEVQELDIEEALLHTFPEDIIESVEKGEVGADAKQIVRSPSGRTICGVILWESKRTKNWSDGWVLKLKDDTRKIGADIAAIVTSVLPEGIAGMGQQEGVWICERNLLIPLAVLLREILVKVAYQKTAQAHQGRKADLIYEYVTGNMFRQQIEAILEAYREMNDQIGKERAWYEKSWKQREAQLRRIILASANVYGSMQGLAGNNALPELNGIALPDPDG